MRVVIKDRDTGEMREFRTHKEAGKAYGVTGATVSQLLSKYDGCPEAVGRVVGIGRLAVTGRGVKRGVPVLGYKSRIAAADALGVHQTTLWRHERAGTLEQWAASR